MKNLLIAIGLVLLGVLAFGLFMLGYTKEVAVLGVSGIIFGIWNVHRAGNPDAKIAPRMPTFEKWGSKFKRKK